MSFSESIILPIIHTESKTRKCRHQTSQAVNNIYYCVYRALVDDTKESLILCPSRANNKEAQCSVSYILATQLECNDEQNTDSGERQISDIIPALQLFSYMILIIAKLLRAYHTPGQLVYNLSQLILINPIK